MYQLESRIRYSETDKNACLTYQGLLNYFQDTSTQHSESLGASAKELMADKMAWVLSFWQIKINRLPELSEDVLVSTWPYRTEGLFGQRNFCMDSAEGERLAYANSIWVLVDTQTGRPLRITPEVAAHYPSEPQLQMDYCDRKVNIPKEYEEMEPVQVPKYFIDTNHHVNNANYVMLAAEYLPADFMVKEIRVEYKKAAVLGDKLYPRVTTEEAMITVALTDECGHIYAAIQFIR